MLASADVLTPDRARWAEALWTHLRHGGDALEFVLEQMRDARRADDSDTVDWWQGVGHRVVQLAMRGTLH